jgi:hypothetical protein
MPYIKKNFTFARHEEIEKNAEEPVLDPAGLEPSIFSAEAQYINS